MGTGLPYLLFHGNAGDNDDDSGNGNDDDKIVPMEQHRPIACPLTVLSEVRWSLKHFCNHSGFIHHRLDDF